MECFIRVSFQQSLSLSAQVQGVADSLAPLVYRAVSLAGQSPGSRGEQLTLRPNLNF